MRNDIPSFKTQKQTKQTLRWYLLKFIKWGQKSLFQAEQSQLLNSLGIAISMMHILRSKREAICKNKFQNITLHEKYHHFVLVISL